MTKCKFVYTNPLTDVDICTNPELDNAASGAYVVCALHKINGTQHSCPRAIFEEDDSKKNDVKVNHPNHYCQGGIECSKAIEASMSPEGFQDYCKGNVLKYIWRWRDKAGVEDLKKARVYLNWMIESAEKEKGESK